VIDTLGCDAQQVISVGIGVSAEVMGSWLAAAEAELACTVVFAVIDIVRQDASTHSECNVQHDHLYRRHGAPKSARAVWSVRNDARGRMRASSTRYPTIASVHSGETDTTVTDVLNACLSVEEAVRRLGARALVTGDGIMVVSPSDAWARGGEARLQRCANGQGFELELEVVPRGRCEHISACWWPTVDAGEVMGPKPGRVLSKTMWSVDKHAGRKWLASVVAGLDHRCRHVPFLRVVLRNYHAVLCGEFDLTQERDAAPWQAWPDSRHEAGVLALEAAAARYGMTVGQAAELEAWLAEVTSDAQPVLLEHPLLDMVVAVDC
jgi:hypothetical protein